jgi:hypothetical protein
VPIPRNAMLTHLLLNSTNAFNAIDKKKRSSANVTINLGKCTKY